MSECNLAELQQSNDSFPLLVISGPLSLSCCDRSVFARFSPCSINSKADFFIFCPFFSSVSAEIGDFDESHCRSHLLNNNYIPDQMPLIDKIMEFHSKHMWVCELYTTVKNNNTRSVGEQTLFSSAVNRKCCYRLCYCPTGLFYYSSDTFRKAATEWMGYFSACYTQHFNIQYIILHWPGFYNLFYSLM